MSTLQQEEPLEQRDNANILERLIAVDIQLNGLSHQLDHLAESVTALNHEIYGNAFRQGLVRQIVDLGKQLDGLTERHERLESIIYRNYQTTFGVGLIVVILSVLQFIFSLGR